MEAAAAAAAAAVQEQNHDEDTLLVSHALNPRTGRRRESRNALESAAAAAEIGSEFETSLPDDEDDDAVMMSPGGGFRPRRRGVDKEMALKRNAARRQKSSDMLGAMRDATRSIPARSQSSMAAFERKAPDRTKSGGVFGNGGSTGDDDADQEKFIAAMSMSGPIRTTVRRAPPPRTKSGDGFAGRTLGVGGDGRPVRRAPPARTKSGGVFKPTQEVDDEEDD